MKEEMLRVRMSGQKFGSLARMSKMYGCASVSDYVRMTLDYFAQHQPPVVRLPSRDSAETPQGEKETS